MEQQVMKFQGNHPTDAVHARNQLSMMMARRNKQGLVPPVDEVRFIHDGNLTLVMVKSGDNQFLGWAKFNPNDVKKLKQISKRGKPHIKTESKFNAGAGRKKALHRALEKML